VNPTRYPRRVPRLLRLVRRSLPARVHVTESREDFIHAVRDYARGQGRHLLVWGGDGTVHDAVNALMNVSEEGTTGARPAVGFLRGGSGNGTQDSYDVPRRLSTQIAAYRTAIEQDMTVDVDLLRISVGGTERYGQLTGLGFDTRVLQRRLKGRSGIIPAGVLRYIYAATRVFFSSEWAHRAVRLRLQEGKYAFRGIRINAEFAFRTIERDLSLSLLEIGSRPYYGALFKVCPDVVCNDGLMDVYAYAFTRRFQVLRNVGALWAGRHGLINSRLMGAAPRGVIERYEVQGADLQVPGEAWYHVDGELLPLPAEPAERLVRVRMAPRALRFLVPPSFYRPMHPFP